MPIMWLINDNTTTGNYTTQCYMQICNKAYLFVKIFFTNAYIV